MRAKIGRWVKGEAGASAAMAQYASRWLQSSGHDTEEEVGPSDESERERQREEENIKAEVQGAASDIKHAFTLYKSQRWKHDSRKILNARRLWFLQPRDPPSWCDRGRNGGRAAEKDATGHCRGAFRAALRRLDCCPFVRHLNDPLKLVQQLLEEALDLVNLPLLENEDGGKRQGKESTTASDGIQVKGTRRRSSSSSSSSSSSPSLLDSLHMTRRFSAFLDGVSLLKLVGDVR